MIEPRAQPQAPTQAQTDAADWTSQWSQPQGAQPIADWTPEMGSVKGANYEWGYAMRNFQSAQKPSWLERPAAPLPTLGTTTGTNPPPWHPTLAGGSISPQTVLGDQSQGELGFWNSGAGAVAMGAARGEQRGGSIDMGGLQIATLPLTITNAPMYFQEALPALLARVMGGGDAYQEQPDGTVSRHSDVPFIGPLIDGMQNMGDGAMKVINDVFTTNNRIQATARIQEYARMRQSGHTELSIVQWIGDRMGVDRGNLDTLKAEAERRGVSWDEMLRTAYDIPKAQADQIDTDPAKYAQGQLGWPEGAAWELANGVDLSLDPMSNALANMGNQALLIGAGAAALGPLTAAAGAIGGVTLGGTAAGEAIGTGAQLAAQAVSLASKAYAVNGAIGIGIRSTEWLTKQYAVMVGDKGLADQVDKLLWDRPLSTNDGLNFVAAFGVHAFETGRNALHGRLIVGHEGHAGEIGAIDVRRGGITKIGNPEEYLTVKGRQVRLRPMQRIQLGKYREMGIDSLYEGFLRDTGVSIETVKAEFGEGNPHNLTADDLRDGILGAYGQARREQSGVTAVIDGATTADRTEAFWRQEGDRILEMMKSDADGKTHYLRDIFQKRFWDNGGLRYDDSAMGAAKRPFGPFDPFLAVGDFASLIRASKQVDKAFSTRDEMFMSQPRHRSDVNMNAVNYFRENNLQRYAPDAIVSARDINFLKKTAGLIERRGDGNRLISRRQGQPPKLTRMEVEGILQSVEKAYVAEKEAGTARPLFTPEETSAMVADKRATREEAAKAGKPVAEDNDPLGPPTDDATARVTGVSLTSVKILNDLKSANEATRAGTDIPVDLLEWYAKAARPITDGILENPEAKAALWKEIGRVWDDRIRTLKGRSWMVHTYNDLPAAFQQRVDAGVMDPALAASAADAIPDIVAALSSPIGAAERVVTDTVRDTSFYPAPAEAVTQWERENPWAVERVQAADEAAKTLAGEAANIIHQGDDFDAATYLQWQPVKAGEETFAYPRTMAPADIPVLNDQIDRAAKVPGISAADQSLFNDPAISPLAKVERMQATLGEQPPKGAVDAAGKPWTHTELEKAASNLKSHENAMNKLAADVSAIARKLALEPVGGYSDAFRAADETYVALKSAGYIGDGRLVPEDFQQVPDVPEVRTPAEPIDPVAMLADMQKTLAKAKPADVERLQKAVDFWQAKVDEGKPVAPHAPLPDAAAPVAGEPTNVGDYAAEYTGRVENGAAEVRMLEGPDHGTLVDVPMEAPAAAAPVAAPEAPAVAPPVFIDKETGDLYSKYMTGTTGHLPTSVAEVMSALESLDLDMQAGLDAVDTVRLHGALHRWLDQAFERRAKAQVGERPARAPGEWIDPKVVGDEIRQVLHALPRMIVEDPEALPLRGFEGTQYDFGPVPTDPSLPPRIMYSDPLLHFDDIIPGLGEELLTRRKPKWERRVDDALLHASMTQRLPLIRHILRFADTVAGARDERSVVHEAIGRFTRELVGEDHPDWTADDWTKAEGQARGVIRVWDEWMRSPKNTTDIGPLSITRYRKRSAIGAGTLEELAGEHLAGTPWYQDFLKANAGEEHPVAQAWLKADNRIRSHWADMDGGAARMMTHALESVYGNRVARELSGAQRALGYLYSTLRFSLETRWLALNAAESFILTLSKEGPEPVLEAHGFFWDKGVLKRGTKPVGPDGRPIKGALIKEALPFAFNPDQTLEHLRTNWSFWHQQMEVGMNVGRIRYIGTNVHSLQVHRFPQVLKTIFEKDPVAQDLLEHMGQTPMDQVRALAGAYDLATGVLKDQKVLTPEEAAKRYQPLLDNGTISKLEYEDAVAKGRWTPNPELQQAIDAVRDPRMRPLLERLSFLTDQYWNDSARLHFGQLDRSNLQRLMNHPLLFWPTSYMIHATRWLGGVLFDRALGRDTGMAGAWTLARIHQQHVKNMQDPEYKKFFDDHPMLLFIGEMLIPITPYGAGVSLSPMTKAMLEAGNNLFGNHEPMNITGGGPLDFGPMRSIEMLSKGFQQEADNAPDGTFQKQLLTALSSVVPPDFFVHVDTSHQ